MRLLGPCDRVPSQAVAGGTEARRCPVDAAFATLQYEVERITTLEPPMDAHIVIPYFANAFQRVAI